jgi:glycosyltransferase involved in cell wall biosynthesis
MKIAFFCSSRSIIPPPKTGGIEWATYYLVRELAKRGHKITLYAAAGSKVPGVKIREISPFPTLIKQKYANLQKRITSFYDLTAFANFFRTGDDKNFDLIHCTNYIFYEILPFTKWSDIPTVIQICYPHDTIYPYLKKYLKQFKNVYYLPGSNFIKTAMPDLPYLGPLYPAVDPKDFPPSFKRGNYLFFLGRICPEKAPHLAIQAALIAKKQLIIAGGVTESNQEYFRTLIQPRIDNKNIIYIGEIDLKTRVKIYQGALALLFSIQWKEPCGNVVIESMFCGTPVIAFDRAAVREIVKNKVSGYIVPDGNVEKMARAVKQIGKISRRKVRRYAEDNFSIEKMVDQYEKIYRTIILKNKKKS